MDFEQALRAELIAIPGLDTKVFPVNAPEVTAAPYATYESSDLAEIKTHEGFSDTGTLECTVDVFGNTYGEMKTVSRATKEKIKTFLGRTMGTGGPYIQNLTFDDLLPEMYEPNVDLYRKSITFTVFY